MFRTERTIVSLPDNEARPTANWFEGYGLSDDTARGNARSDRKAP